MSPASRFLPELTAMLQAVIMLLELTSSELEGLEVLFPQQHSDADGNLHGNMQPFTMADTVSGLGSPLFPGRIFSMV